MAAIAEMGPKHASLRRVWPTGRDVWPVAVLLGVVALVVNAVAAPKVRWMVASVVPAVVVYAGLSSLAWYMNAFVVKPNELVRETPYIANNIAMTRDEIGRAHV